MKTYCSYCKTTHNTPNGMCPKCLGTGMAQHKRGSRKGWDQLATTKKHGQRRGDSLKDL